MRLKRAMAKPTAVRPSAEYAITKPLITKKAGTPMKPYFATGVSQGIAGIPFAPGAQKPKWYNTTPSTATRRNRSSASTRGVGGAFGGMEFNVPLGTANARDANRSR